MHGRNAGAAAINGRKKKNALTGGSAAQRHGEGHVCPTGEVGPSDPPGCVGPCFVALSDPFKMEAVGPSDLFKTSTPCGSAQIYGPVCPTRRSGQSGPYNQNFAKILLIQIQISFESK